jgi:hypothetical protein
MLPEHPTHIQWLSGEIVTPLNMYVLPWLWYASLAAGIAYLALRLDHLPDLRRRGTVGIVLAAMTIFVAWVSTHTKRRLRRTAGRV